MLFKDKLDAIHRGLEPEFDKLLEDILSSQTHDGDLLLIRLNGCYSPDVYSEPNGRVYSPYTFGPHKEGLSENSHYQFIHNYRTNALSSLNHAEYLKSLIYSPEDNERINKLVEDESISIQLEMLIYLKIWEADLFIKKLYQLVRLAFGDSYDWHFKIKESNRDLDTTGNRETIIRKLIRDKIKEKYPKIFMAIKSAYKTQVRNSIAHSKYSFLNRYIHLNNYIEEDEASQLVSLKFDEWIDIFNNTMVLYNLMIKLFNNTDKLYEGVAKENDNKFEVRIGRKFPREQIEYRLLKYIPEFKAWNWVSNEEQ